VNAISDMAGATTPPPDQNPGDGGPHPSKGDKAKARALLQQAQADFAAADQAYQQGKGAKWVALSHRARTEVAKALNLLG
jgi:hypothetical protein